MNKTKDYLQLHLNILLFSLTSVFSKCASVQYNKGGLTNPLLYLFLFLMAANCGIYAIAWQKVIKKFTLSTAYANRSVYLIWSQLWAVLIFHENLTIKNIIGLLIVLVGVMVVQRYE
ncbi:MAG: EamA family transporter [Fusicatenibacter sp.]|nr:EamA family transporter [Fusicatenibacter sp.]